MSNEDAELAKKSRHEALQRLLQDMTVAQRLAGLSLEQVLACYTPEQLVAALPPELARKLRD